MPWWVRRMYVEGLNREAEQARAIREGRDPEDVEEQEVDSDAGSLAGLGFSTQQVG